MKNELEKKITDIINILMPIDGFLMALRIVLTYSLFDFGTVLVTLGLFIWGIAFSIILLNTYSKRELLISILLLICGVLVFKHSNSLIPFYSVAFLIANKRVNLNRVLNGYFLGVLFGILIVFFVCGFTVFPDGAYTFGLVNPNMFSHFIVMEIVIWIYFRYNRICWLELFILIAFSFFVGKLTKCRTGIGISFLIIFTAFLSEIDRHFREFLRKRINLICVVIAIVNVLMVVFFRKVPLFSLLNRILSGRLFFANKYFELYGLTLFGVDISDISKRLGYMAALDSGYIRMLVNFGFIYFIFYIFVFLKTCRELNKNSFNNCSILILSVFLGLVAESLWIPINSNILFIFCSIFVFPREGIQRNQDTKTIMKYFFKLNPVNQKKHSTNYKIIK